MDFASLITRQIDKRFCYIQYDNFELIMMKENNYINATKLCVLGNKRFRNWLRLEGTCELIKEAEYINGIWKTPTCTATNKLQMIINVESEGKNDKKYEVSGSYIHPDLIPHITSWISPSFAMKVSKVINCYMSGKYELKLKEKEVTNKELLELLYAFDKKYDRDTAELKERYREQRKETKELKSNLTELKEKYDIDTQELKEQNKKLEYKLERIEERLKDKVINPSSVDKLHYLVILQKKENPYSFKTLRLQRGRINQETNKYKHEYRIFFSAYEPNAVSCFNRLKEKLLEQERVKCNYNDFNLCDIENYDVMDLTNDLHDLDLVRKYA